jgi:hypothetical protein
VLPLSQVLDVSDGGLGNALWDLAGARPSLDLDFATTKSLADLISGQNLITYTRLLAATYVGSDGLIKTAAANEPRFTHNPTTLESLGLLVEEQRANLLLWSRTLTNAAWVATNITPAKDQIGADGISSSASKITASAANGTILQSVTSASAARATSAYVKRITGTGAISMTQDGGATWTAVTVSNSWERVSIPSATVANPSVGFRVSTSGDAIAVDYVQCENGSLPTSPIETTTISATRNADVVNNTGANFSSWYNQSEGTVLAQYRFPQSPNTGGARVYQFSNSTGSNVIWLRAQGGTNRIYDVTDASVSQASFFAGVYAAGTEYRGAVSVKANDFAFAENGGTLQTDTSGTVPSVDRIGIGMEPNSSSAQGNVIIKRLTYWPKALPTKLQAITA